MNLFNPITKNDRALFLAYDQGMEHGPSDFNDENADPEYIMKIAESGFFTGVIFQKGIAHKYYDKSTHKTPLIVKLNGKTNLLKNSEPYSPPICSITEAVALGAKAVGYTIYVGSEYEAQMMRELAPIEEEAHRNNLAVILWMYPRGKAILGRERSSDILKYASRLGLELGADMIKTLYPSDPAAFSEMVHVAGKAKIVVSGGTKETDEELYKLTEDVIKAGAAGMAVGRNIWQNDKPLERAEKLSKIIFNTSS